MPGTSNRFGDLLRQYRARKAGLSQSRLAQLAGYDQAVLVRMSQGKKDLTGPSGRERVLRLIEVLHTEQVLSTQAEANALLKAAGMPPLYDGQPAELALIKTLKADGGATASWAPLSVTSMQTAPMSHLTNLPVQLTHFVGREREITEVRQLLTETRLLTFTGSGGCGKTRLAIEIGASFVGATGLSPLTTPFPDGVWLVELAPLTEPALVAAAVAATFDLDTGSRLATVVLAEYLADRELLLILDNCEHLIQASAE